jgi:hypothetical protein
MKSPSKRAFTLVEMCVATVCVALLALIVIRLLQAGTRASLQGILRVDTTLEARRILRQVQTDVKSACMQIDVSSGCEVTIDRVFHVGGSLPKVEYFFYSFPQHGEVTDFAQDTGAYTVRKPSLIHYFLRDHPDPKKNPYLQLVRREYYHRDHPLAAKFPNRCRESVLSDRVNIFKLEPRVVPTVKPYRNQSFVWVTLQLVETFRKTETGVTVQKDWKKASQGVIVSDFFDVVYPEFYHALLNNGFMNRNWNNRIVGID